MLRIRLLALDESTCQSDFSFNALRGQQIGLDKPVFGLAEVIHLDQAFVDHPFQALVHTAGANAPALSDVAPDQIGAVLLYAQNPEVGVFLKLTAAAEH